MSNNFNTPSGWEWNKSTETVEIIPLPVDRKQPAINEAKEELKLLTKDMQKISHADFLTKVEHADRLKHLTDPNIDASEISENTKIEFNFSFTSEKRNDRLYLLTTAGQVLPSSVSNVTTNNGKQYSRESVSWEFFASDGKRLKIHDKTQITIWELRDEKIIEKESADKLQNAGSIVKDDNRKLLSMWISKWIDPALVLNSLSGYFGTDSFEEINEDEYEDFLTQFDREIGYMNMDEKIIDKNNLTEENKIELIDRMGDKTSMDSIDYQMEDFAELKDLATECGIRNPEFLYAIWELESSCGRNVNPRQESRGRESLGMFQILNVNLPDSLAYELKNNPSDKDVNIRALRHFINNNHWLVAAINSNNYEQVASIYNGNWYDSLATKNGWTPYDDKLRNSVAGYYDRVNYSMVA